MFTRFDLFASLIPFDHSAGGPLAESGTGPAAGGCPTDPAADDPDDQTRPPEPYDRRPALRITRAALDNLLGYLCGRPPEAGGVLIGRKGSDLVTRFLPDTDGEATAASFTWGWAALNEKIRPLVARGFDVKGLVHSHPAGCPAPSSGDRGYLQRVFDNPRHVDLTRFLFPIVEGGRLHPYVAHRDEPTGPFRLTPASLVTVADPPRHAARRPCRRGGAADFSRIATLIDVPRLQRATVGIVGCGGGANLARNLVRSGVGRVHLIDHDRIEAVNVCRQEYGVAQIGRRKVDALDEDLRRINPDARVHRHARNLLDFTDRQIDRALDEADLLVAAVDNLDANARLNEIALRLGKKAVWSGLYAGGGAGEVAFWKPDLPCYRCLCGARYAARERGESVAQPAESADIFAVQFLDSVTGMVALGLLTEGADNGYGRLIQRLGRRNFLQLKLSPDWTWRGRDIFREQLRIPADCPAYFSFLSIAREDPDGGDPPCPDCVRFRQA